MTKLIYITHPSVQIDKTVLPQFWKLSDKGLSEAQILLDLPFWNEVEVIYSSSEEKAKQVAHMAAEKYNLPWFIEQDLGEADRTATPFLPLEEYMAAIQEAYVDPDKNIHGWESHRHMMERNAKVLEKIKLENKGKTIAIIGHGGAGTTIKCYIKNIEPDFAEDPKQTGCIFIADLDNNTIVQDWEKY